MNYFDKKMTKFHKFLLFSRRIDVIGKSWRFAPDLTPAIC